MKKTLITAAVTLFFAIPAFAADDVKQSQAAPEQKEATQALTPDQKFDQRKARMIKHADKQIARAQESKACYEAAKTKDELKACKGTSKHKGRKHHQKKDKQETPQAEKK